MKHTSASLPRLLPRLLAPLMLGAACSAFAQTAGPGQPALPGRAITSVQFGAANPGWTPSQIEVFATSAMYIANAEHAAVYRVDGRTQLMAEINQNGLPSNPGQAMEIARKRMRAMGPELNRRVAAALLAVEKTVVYGVQRVPAMVFDGRRVVYGVTDVNQAVDIVRRGGGQPIGPRFAPGRVPSSVHYQAPAGLRPNPSAAGQPQANGRTSP